MLRQAGRSEGQGGRPRLPQIWGTKVEVGDGVGVEVGEGRIFLQFCFLEGGGLEWRLGEEGAKEGWRGEREEKAYLEKGLGAAGFGAADLEFVFTSAFLERRS